MLQKNEASICGKCWLSHNALSQSNSYICKKAGEMFGASYPRLPVQSVTMMITVAKLQLSCSCVKSASHGIITGSGSCNRKTPRRNRELTEKCSKLPGVVWGITPLARCIPVEERRFLDGECLSTFSLDSDKTQCVALNVRLGQVLSSKNCFY